MMKKLAIAAAICLLTSVTGFAGIETQLDFSTDGGKTWSEDFLILKKSNPKCKVRVKFKVSLDDETEKIPMNIVSSSLFSTTNNFASANRGKQHFAEVKKGAWYQMLKDYYRGLKSTKPFIYDLDLGARKAGEMGKMNKWEKGKFVDAPLPECKALPPGSYKFYISVDYRTESRKRVDSTQSFDIVITEEN